MISVQVMQEKLQRFEEQINNDEKKKANIEGKKENIMEKLKKDFGITNIDDINQILEEKTKELEKIQIEIEGKMQQLESNYDWE